MSDRDERPLEYRNLAESDRDVAVLAAERLRKQRDYWIRQAMAFSEHADNMRLALLEPCSALLCERGETQRPQPGESNTPMLTSEEREAIMVARTNLTETVRRGLQKQRAYIQSGDLDHATFLEDGIAGLESARDTLSKLLERLA